MVRGFLLTASLLFAAGSASAQAGVEPGSAAASPRRGFWTSLGVGAGSHGVSCYDCIGVQRETGFSTSFRAGGTLSRSVTLGVDLVAWLKPLNDPGRGEYAFLAALMGEVQVYPLEHQNLFVLGGGGYIVDVVDDDLVFESPGLVVGVGVDIRAGRNFSVTPQIRYLRTIDGGALTSTLYQFGIAATWH